MKNTCTITITITTSRNAFTITNAITTSRHHNHHFTITFTTSRHYNHYFTPSQSQLHAITIINPPSQLPLNHHNHHLTPFQSPLHHHNHLFTPSQSPLHAISITTSPSQSPLHATARSRSHQPPLVSGIHRLVNVEQLECDVQKMIWCGKWSVLECKWKFKIMISGYRNHAKRMIMRDMDESIIIVAIAVHLKSTRVYFKVWFFLYYEQTGNAFTFIFYNSIKDINRALTSLLLVEKRCKKSFFTE